MKFKILLRCKDSVLKNKWEVYGTTTISGTTTTFEEFETEDRTVLQDKIKELDKEIGFENIRVVSDQTYDIAVSVGEE